LVEGKREGEKIKFLLGGKGIFVREKGSERETVFHDIKSVTRLVKKGEGFVLKLGEGRILSMEI